MKNNIKPLIFIIIVVILCIFSVFYLLADVNGSSKIAYIYVNNELYKTINLNDSYSDCDFIIETDHGYNRIVVKDGFICVTEADCPDKTCINTGWTDSKTNPVICIPHRLEIVVEDCSEIDGVTG